jgi:hypothetical protein
MHGPINVKSPNNTSKWQMGFNSAFKGLKTLQGKEKIKKKCFETTSLCLQLFLLALQIRIK